MTAEVIALTRTAALLGISHAAAMATVDAIAARRQCELGEACERLETHLRRRYLEGPFWSVVPAPLTELETALVRYVTRMNSLPLHVRRQIPEHFLQGLAE